MLVQSSRCTPQRSQNGAKRKRILLLAEVANPEMVSTPLVAWSVAEALARHADVHLVTHIRNREAIARLGWREGIDFTTIDTERLVRRIFAVARLMGAHGDRGWTILQALAPIGCYAFERTVWKMFRPGIDAGRFDLVHRITPMSPTTPSILGPYLKAAGVPFVIGPLNGGLPWPAGFADRMLSEREWLTRARTAYKFLPGYRSTRRDPAAVIAGSKHTLNEFGEIVGARGFYLPENGIDPLRFGKRRTRRAAAPLRGAFVGRLVPCKCVDVLIEAAANLLRSGMLTLDVIGDGPERGTLVALADRLAVSHAITFHGMIEHRRVQDLLIDCDFLALPSIKEFGGGAVLEAMALGIAPIVADYGGPSELVDDLSGIRIPFRDAGDLRAGFRSALEELTVDPTRLDRLGDAAAERVEALFTWDRKVEQLLRLYDWVLSGGAKPDLLAPGPPPSAASMPANRPLVAAI